MLDHVDLLIEGGQLVTEEGVFAADVAVDEGRIAAVGPALGEKVRAQRLWHAKGFHLLPGIIDTHVHCNEPGREHWEGFETAARSLAAGGVTTFFDMPLNSEPTVSLAALQRKRARLAGYQLEQTVLQWGGLVPDHLDDLYPMYDAGVVGFKAFLCESGLPEYPPVDDFTLLEGMRRIAALDGLLALHAEDGPMVEVLSRRIRDSGATNAAAYCAARPVDAEVAAVAKASAYALATGCRLHLLHLSSGSAVAAAQWAKQRGADISIETCPHYLALCQKDFEELGSIAKCAPPLRPQEEVQALWEAIRQGEIDTVASDHSPAPPELKARDDLFEAWGGISGAQTTLAVLLEEGYWRRGIPLSTIVRLTSANPARRFGLFPRKGSLLPGSDADLVVVNLELPFTLRENDLLYRHKQSPFLGRTFRGTVLATVAGGRLLYAHDGARGAMGEVSDAERGIDGP